MGIELPEVAQKTQKGRHLSHGEEKSLDHQISDLENQVKGSEIVQGLNHEVRDKGAVERRIAELKRIRETRSVTRATGREAEAIEREVASLTEKLQVGMPTWKDYSFLKRKDGMNYIQLRNWIVKSELDETRKSMIARWKYLKRRLDPDDPHAASMMNLFPQK